MEFYFSKYLYQSLDKTEWSGDSIIHSLRYFREHNLVPSTILKWLTATIFQIKEIRHLLPNDDKHRNEAYTRTCMCTSMCTNTHTHTHIRSSLNRIFLSGLTKVWAKHYQTKTPSPGIKTLFWVVCQGYAKGSQNITAYFCCYWLSPEMEGNSLLLKTPCTSDTLSSELELTWTSCS